MDGNFVELRARSAFSFGEGTLAPEVLARRAAEMGYTAMALCDSTDLGGVIRFALEAERAGLQPIAGAEIRVAGYPATFLARDETGYHNLSALVSQARLGSSRGRAGISFAQMAERSEGLQALTGPPGSEVAAHLREAAPHPPRWRWPGGGKSSDRAWLWPRNCTTSRAPKPRPPRR